FISSVEKTERVVLQIRRDLSITPPANQPPPRMFVGTRIEVKPDKVEEWITLMKSDVLPALRKAGVKSSGVASARLGAPFGTFFISEPIDKAAELDGPSPLETGMGADNFRKFVQKAAPLTSRMQTDTFRVRADLSYVPQQGASTSGGR